ncbi:MAG TPA: DUF3418 domain-containing protein, partial [Solirubrobacteraceae bacterium]|nr:DUF3418 domain-containing protein [Solirubrobacteraceae bacterium]
LKWLPQLRPVGFDWLVPALRAELVTALIRSLPKDLRRPLVPVPEVAAAVLGRMRPRSEPLLDALARELEALRGVRIPRDAWDLDRLPPHLRMTFRVEDERGALVAEGPDLDTLREQVRPRLRRELASAAAPLEHHGLTRPTFGTLPKVVALPGTGTSVRGYPALVDEGGSVGVRVLETPEAQREAMQAGTRKLLALNVPSPIRHVQGTLGNAAQLALAAAPHGSPRAVLEDATVAALEALMAEAGGPAWDEAGFARLRDHVAGDLADTTARVVTQVVAILDAARAVERGLEPLARAPALAPAREDVERQLRRLVHPGFITATGVKRLPDVERYLRAAARRLERLPNAPAPDLDRMRGIHELEREYEAGVASWPAGRPLPPALRDVPWLLEELRVSHFAQSLGTRGQVSAKRIRKVIQEAPR